ncbi:MAG TPA: hypothetical protein PKY81_01905 [bacterium]|nr:hypothetical protein [bacterium]HPN29689.1 hypothetical protein [bacterium]
MSLPLKSKPKKIFALLLIIEFLPVLFMILNGRRPLGHDEFQYFSLQYYFLNNSVASGETAQWMPFMTHGTVSTWWYAIQSGFVANALFLFAKLISGINFIPLYYLGIYFDEIFLFAGTFCLAKRLYASNFSVLFACLTLIAGCCWRHQIWWNFHLYYAVPLIIYFFHKWFDERRWKYFFLAFNLFAVQTLGNLFYFLPLIALTIFLYFLFYFCFNFNEFKNFISNIKINTGAVFSSAGSVISILIIYYILNVNTGSIISHIPGRNPDGDVSLSHFLEWGGNLHLFKWSELLMGISYVKDFTLYSGILFLPLLVIAVLLGITKKNAHIFFTALFLFLFSFDKVTGSIAYYLSPGMKYFRHRAYIVPLLKLFLIFIAGYGFEILFFKKFEKRKNNVLNSIIIFSIVFFLGLSVFLNNYKDENLFSKNSFFQENELNKTFKTFINGRYVLLIDKPFFIVPKNKTVLFLLTAALFFIIRLASNLKNKKYFYLIFIFFIVHFFDLYSFKIYELLASSIELDEFQREIVSFNKMPYKSRRGLELLYENPRFIFYMNPINSEFDKREKMKFIGTFYWTNDSFLFKDSLNSNDGEYFKFKTDHWQKSVDKYLNIYNGSASTVPAHPISKQTAKEFNFKTSHPAAYKISGVIEDKIQFFSGACFIRSETAAANYLNDSNYAGDILFLENQNINESIMRSDSIPEKVLKENRRLHLPYKIADFSSNRLSIEVNSPDSNVYLLYSDAWHPGWKADINGIKSSVYKANIAYKSVKLNAGINIINFYFKNNVLAAAYWILSINSLFWIIYAFKIIFSLFF